MNLDTVQEYLAPILITGAISFGGYTVNGFKEVNLELATLKAEQVEDKRINAVVIELSSIIPRMDANILHIKENQDRTYKILSAQ